MLKLINITKDYRLGNNAIPALRNLSLEFRKNEFVSILGPSGCGKTTLLNIIGGLDRYTKGDLIINGKTTKEFNDSDWDAYRNSSIGFVFQTYNLIPHQTVLGNVELAMTLSGVSSSERKRRATEVLTHVGLSDQLSKRPNQLSGGQMQRVAIARALVNNPDILLADEPTGALDSVTSVQILDLLKIISKDKLVIMVTHNSELAHSYSNRIVELLDGEVIRDDRPYTDETNYQTKQLNTQKKGKTSMSFFTALRLSFRNLITKKARTFLTAFAGSIGIIGIALVLALTNGFNAYVSKMQSDTLSSYPLTIEKNSYDYTSLMSSSMMTNLGTKFPVENKLFIRNVDEKLQQALRSNNITQPYLDYVEVLRTDSNVNDISYIYKVGFRAVNSSGVLIRNNTSSTIGSMGSSFSSSSGWSQLPDNLDFINSQYDILAGHLPTNKNELIIITDAYNQVLSPLLEDLGTSYEGEESIDFSTIIGDNDTSGVEFRLLLADDYYVPNGDNFSAMTLGFDTMYNNRDAENTLKVVGILRTNQETSVGVLSSGINYSSELIDYIIEQNATAPVVLAQLAEADNAIPIDVLTGLPLNYTQSIAVLTKILGYTNTETPDKINIYPKDFAAKTEIKAYLDDYNTMIDNNDTDYPTEDDKTAAKIYYSDLMAVLVSSLNTLVDSISYVLIAFTAISLVVSSIMIGIITYVSVIERTKEIGVLRSIGARKKDISRVFNAETIIIGFTSGIIGVIICELLTIPINIIINSLVDGIGNIAVLNPIHSLSLIIISIFLTFIAGLIPSRIAANKDPVVALRTE